MNQEAPTISVIIPTHNRSASLRRTLDALKLQDYPLQQVEVVVVADGCRDETVEMLRQYNTPFTLNVIEQPCQGAAVARNQGATVARGSLLLFLDDDIEAAPSLVRAHVETHQQPDQVAIGYLPPVLNHQTGFFKIALRGWWEAMFQAMRHPGHRYRYTDLLSGNFSLTKELFDRLGGFDPAFRCQEDYELGVRLLKAGVVFTFAPDALGYHHEVTSLERSLQRKYHEGRASVQLGRKYSELIPTLPLFHSRLYSSLIGQVWLTLIFQLSAIGDPLATKAQTMLEVLERTRLRRYWQKLLDKFMRYWYLRGVADELGTRQALTSFLQNDLIPSDEENTQLELDLREGLTVAEQCLDQKRPVSLRLRYGQQLIATIPPQPGAEPLRAAHLRPTLATTLALPLLQALATEENRAVEETIDSKLSLKHLSVNAESIFTKDAEQDNRLAFDMNQIKRPSPA